MTFASKMQSPTAGGEEPGQFTPDRQAFAPHASDVSSQHRNEVSGGIGTDPQLDLQHRNPGCPQQFSPVSKPARGSLVLNSDRTAGTVPPQYECYECGKYFPAPQVRECSKQDDYDGKSYTILVCLTCLAGSA